LFEPRIARGYTLLVQYPCSKLIEICLGEGLTSHVAKLYICPLTSLGRLLVILDLWNSA